jgi:DNA-binding PadR family transcriptional regulator
MNIIRDRMKPRASAAQSRLPVRPVAFAVLAALAGEPRNGIDVLEHVNATVPNRPILGPGTLYRLLRELRSDGLIARADAPASSAPVDERETHHSLTRLGRDVLAAESDRLTRTLALAGRSHTPARP